jgi:hypothetical protein
MKLLFPKQNYNVLSPSSSERFIHFQDWSAYSAAGNMWSDPGNISIAQRHINVEIWTEKEYKNRIFFAVHFQPSEPNPKRIIKIRLIYIVPACFFLFAIGNSNNPYLFNQ